MKEWIKKMTCASVATLAVAGAVSLTGASVASAEASETREENLIAQAKIYQLKEEIRDIVLSKIENPSTDVQNIRKQLSKHNGSLREFIIMLDDYYDSHAEAESSQAERVDYYKCLKLYLEISQGKTMDLAAFQNYLFTNRDLKDGPNRLTQVLKLLENPTYIEKA